MPDSQLLAEPLLDANEAARLLHVPRSTLYELVRSRGLPHVRIGRPGASVHSGRPRPLDRGEQLRALARLADRLRRSAVQECGGDTAGGVLAGLELEVALGRRQVLVAHPLHDLAGVGVADRVGAKGVA